jgi:hypothetical protein
MELADYTSVSFGCKRECLVRHRAAGRRKKGVPDGIMVGLGDDVFAPENTLTVSPNNKDGMRGAQHHSGGDGTFTQGTPGFRYMLTMR